MGCDETSRALDSLAVHYPDRVAAITYYTNSADPFYLDQCFDRWFQYPPPHFMGGQWWYVIPWMWMDGSKEPGFDHEGWESLLLERMPVPSDVVIRMTGSYDVGTHEGQVDVWVRNEGSESLSGTFQCVLTESGIYYAAPNGLEWHDHVMRTMLPSENGTPITIPAGDSALMTNPFTIDPAWNWETCEIVCFVQDTEMTADSTIEIWQGARLVIPDFAVEEWDEIGSEGPLEVSLRPNPAQNTVVLSFGLEEPQGVRIRIFDISGRTIGTHELGVVAAGRYRVCLDPRDLGMAQGTYFYRLEAGERVTTNRLTVLD